MTEEVRGVVKKLNNGIGSLRDPALSFRSGRDDVFVPPKLMRELPQGASVVGQARPGKRGPELVAIDSVCGIDPRDFAQRKSYKELTAIDPCERFDLGKSGDISMRLMDLFAPVGKGTRGLIVSPPKAGKTMLLQRLCQSITQSDPEAYVVVLLIDERPEEVTDFKRSVDAMVLSSSLDHVTEEHVELAEMALGSIQAEFESGKDVVVLIDSLTRMGRSFNQRSTPGRSRTRGRTMSGGIEVGALDFPRRFFGMARNAENAGSVTILATILVDTGSRADQLIFEEFKGTGNSEIVLSRDLAEARIFPALDLPASGTRKEERLIPAAELGRIQQMRRILLEKGERRAMETLLEMMQKYETNEELLATIPLAKS